MELFYWVLVVAIAGTVAMLFWREIAYLSSEVKRLREKQHESAMEFINHKYDVLDALRVAGLEKKPREPERWVKGRD